MAFNCFSQLGTDVTAVTFNGFDWMSIKDTNGANLLDISFTFTIDKLSGLMALFITGIASLIHLYSIGYMHDDATPWRFFAYLNLFTGMMLVLILGNSLPVMFLGWEGVGLCSYLLIGYWYKEMANCKASQKAFVANRVGDFFFILGIFILYPLTKDHSLTFSSLNEIMANSENQVTLNWATLCLFLGACGKSAQIPLYVWLPDAMAGPTPVSALIHAATMVTSGLYLLARMSPVFIQCPDILTIVTWVGALTALLAALIALTQTDIKKVLAYSTVSQLGYMFVAMGCGAFSVGIFHVFTHAFFKALLFLGSGAVILACHHNQDMRTMGGLRKTNKVIFYTMFIGCIAIAGVPFLSGFFSKEEILAYTLHSGNPLIYWILLATAILTAFYMFRMFFLTFFGEYRGHGHAHPVSKLMGAPLVILAIGSVIAGYAIFPNGTEKGNVEAYLNNAPIVRNEKEANLIHVFNKEAHAEKAFHFSHDTNTNHYIEIGLGVGAGLAGIFYAFFLFGSGKRVPAAGEKFKNKWINLSYQKFYVDEIYEYFILMPIMMISRLAHFVGDRLIIEGIVNGGAYLVGIFGKSLRALQTGKMGHYALAMGLGLAAILVWLFFVAFKEGLPL